MSIGRLCFAAANTWSQAWGLTVTLSIHLTQFSSIMSQTLSQIVSILKRRPEPRRSRGGGRCYSVYSVYLVYLVSRSWRMVVTLVSTFIQYNPQEGQSVSFNSPLLPEDSSRVEGTTFPKTSSQLLWESPTKLKVITEPYNRLQEKNFPR